MFRCIAGLWLFLCCCLTVFAEEAEKAVFALPERPESHVSDPNNWMSVDARNAWNQQLELWKKNDGIDLYVVILPSLQGTPADHVAREIGTAWGRKELHGVVLFVPGTGPSLYWGGKVSDEVALDPRARQAMIRSMERRVRSQMSEEQQLSSAIDELSTTMRVMNAQWKQSRLVRQKFDETIFKKATERKFKWRLQLVGVAVMGLIALTVLIFLIVVWRRRTKTFTFPNISPQRRFGAIHAGGSGASLTLTEKRQRL